MNCPGDAGHTAGGAVWCERRSVRNRADAGALQVPHGQGMSRRSRSRQAGAAMPGPATGPFSPGCGGRPQPDRGSSSRAERRQEGAAVTASGPGRPCRGLRAPGPGCVRLPIPQCCRGAPWRRRRSVPRVGPTPEIPAVAAFGSGVAFTRRFRECAFRDDDPGRPLPTRPIPPPRMGRGRRRGSDPAGRGAHDRAPGRLATWPRLRAGSAGRCQGHDVTLVGGDIELAIGPEHD